MPKKVKKKAPSEPNDRKPPRHLSAKEQRRGPVFARRNVPISWLRARFVRGRGRNRVDGLRMLTLYAPFGTLLGLGKKTVENVARCKGNRQTLLHSNWRAKWWVIVQSSRFCGRLPRRMDIAERQITEQRRVLSNRSGKRCTRTGIVAVVRVHRVLESTDRRANMSRRYGHWITGDKHWIMLINEAIHIDPPIPCAGNQAPVGIPDVARALLISRLREMDRVYEDTP
jgi:hypothetical protein